MKIKDMTKEELEALSYDDIAYLILEESGTKTKITDLFQEVCNLLELSHDEYEAKIADFFQMLSTDQRFVMLEKGFWDLKSRHQTKIILDDTDEEDLDEENLDDTDEMAEDNDDEIFYDDEENDDDSDDDLKDLVIVNEDDADEENGSM